MATHEILTACREFYIATFLFIFNYVSTGCGTFICVSSGGPLPYQLFFWYVSDDIHQTSIHMHVVYLTSNILPLQMEGRQFSSVFICTFPPHPGYMMSGYNLLNVTRCLLPYESGNYPFMSQIRPNNVALNNIWGVVKMPAWKEKPELTVINNESN